MHRDPLGLVGVKLEVAVLHLPDLVALDVDAVCPTMSWWFSWLASVMVSSSRSCLQISLALGRPWLSWTSPS